MRRGQQGPGVPWRTQITRARQLVGPWQYQCAGSQAGWVLGGVLPLPPTQYSIPGTTPPAHRHGTPYVYGIPGYGSLRPTKEILGVGMHRGHAEAAVRCPACLTPQLSGPLPGACTLGFLSISQYFSVYLRIRIS